MKHNVSFFCDANYVAGVGEKGVLSCTGDGWIIDKWCESSVQRSSHWEQHVRSGQVHKD